MTGVNGDAGDKNVLSSAKRVLDGLRLIALSPEPLSLATLATGLGISEVAAYRVARTLMAAGYVRPAAGGRNGYEATWQIVEMSSALLDRSELRTLASGPLSELAGRFGESVTLAVPDGDHVLFVDRINANRNVHFYCDTGRRLPLHVGAASRAILAGAPDAVFRAYLERDLEKYTDSTETDPERLGADRDEIRARGYAVSIEDVEVGISGVGVAILNNRRQVLGAAAIANVSAKWSEDDIRVRGEAMLAVREAIERECGQLTQRFVLGDR